VSYQPHPHGGPPYPFRPGATPLYGYGNQSSKDNGFAIASIVLGGVGCVASLVGFGLFAIPIMAIGLGLGIAALKSASKRHRSGRVMAIVGIVLSTIALVLTFVWIGVLVLALIESGEIS
jgi:lysylphosphatidylglycerol synthetase-like protein (DUF2156 family)